MIWQGGVGREVRKEEQQLIIIGLLPFLWHDWKIATEPKNVIQFDHLKAQIIFWALDDNPSHDTLVLDWML